MLLFLYPFEDTEISLRGPRASARPGQPAVAPSRSKLPRSRSLINFRKPRRHFERALSLDLAVLALKLARPRFPRTPDRRFSRVQSLDFRSIFRSLFLSILCSIFQCIFEVVCRPYRSRTWTGRTSPNPDFVRPVEVFQGFFNIAHPCWRDQNVIERTTIIQKSFAKTNRIFIEKSNKNRRKIESAAQPGKKRVRTALDGASGRPGSAPERPGSSSGASWESCGSVPERPGTLRERSRSVP